MKIRIYVEGGFRGSAATNCRRAFSLFFAKAIPEQSFQVIASGDRRNTYEDFCDALARHPEDYVMLLVDSEEPVTTIPWRHLGLRVGDRWQQPAGTSNDQVHLMVQVMESWFLADPPALATYYGQHFHKASLPRNTNIEQVTKPAVYRALASSTKKTQKGEYHKTRHGFDLLQRIDPNRVRKASPHADRLFQVLLHKIARPDIATWI